MVTFMIPSSISIRWLELRSHHNRLNTRSQFLIFFSERNSTSQQLSNCAPPENRFSKMMFSCGAAESAVQPLVWHDPRGTCAWDRRSINLGDALSSQQLSCVETEAQSCTEVALNSKRRFCVRIKKAANPCGLTTFEVPPEGLEPSTY